jgi:DnaK suppressor protein
MTAEQLQELRRLLDAVQEELRRGLEESADSTAPVGPDSALGRLTRQDAMQMQQMALAIRRRNQSRLEQVEAAIRRIGGGTYGICARCDEEISLARLRVRPEALVCVRCAEGGRN